LTIGNEVNLEMKLKIDCYFEPDTVWLGEINRQSLKLERSSSVFPASTTQLECALWHGVDSKSGITLTLDIAGKRLTSRAEDRSPVAATRRAFNDLNAKVTALTEQFRTQDFWLRTSHNRGLADEPLHKHTPKTKKEVADCIDQVLEQLYNFVRREIAMSQVQGELKAGDLTPEAILDDVAKKALEQFDEKPAELDLRPWLFHLALDTIKCRKRQIERDQISLEEDGRNAKPTGAIAVEDEIYDFYQPDNQIHLKDLISDGRLPTPEEAVIQLEFQQHISRSLAQLPRRWREAFMLYSIEGLTLEEVARVTRQPVDSTRRAIEMAREYLRTFLVEAGVKPAWDELRKEARAS
jgi:RNA polymerase sigma factor (sigma-70 family)